MFSPYLRVKFTFSKGFWVNTISTKTYDDVNDMLYHTRTMNKGFMGCLNSTYCFLSRCQFGEGALYKLTLPPLLIGVTSEY